MRLEFASILIQWGMDKDNLVKCEISFVFNGMRHPTWVMLPAEAVDMMFDKFTEVQMASYGKIKGLSFIVLSSELDGGTASDLLETIRDNVDVEDEKGSEYDWTTLERLAQKVDQHYEDPASKRLNLELVWNCGGGDDNIFTDSFTAIEGHPDTKRFVSALADMGEQYEAFYDLTYYDPDKGHSDDVGLEGLLELVSEIDCQSLTDFLCVVRSLDVRRRLSEIANVETAASAPKPKF